MSEAAFAGVTGDRASLRRKAAVSLSTGALRNRLDRILGRDSAGGENGETKRRSAPLRITMTYDLGCETFRFAWRNHPFHFAFWAVVETQSAMALVRGGAAPRSKKVAQKST